MTKTLVSQVLRYIIFKKFFFPKSFNSTFLIDHTTAHTIKSKYIDA